MKAIFRIKTVLITGTIALFALCQQPKQAAAVCPAGEIVLCKEEVSKRLRELSDDIGARLSAFASEVAGDQLFSLRLLAESNRSAPEVTAKAGQFIKPMGFSVLTILDSASFILSSGDFPASAGNSALQKAVLLADQPKFIVDHIMGKSVLTLQAKRTIRIVDSIPFFVLGGIVIDDTVLARISPREGVVVLLKQGSVVTGMPGVKTITDVKDEKIVINDKEYGAFQVPLPFAGEGEAPVFIVTVDPAKPTRGDR
jgi:hypothetical protein